MNDLSVLNLNPEENLVHAIADSLRKCQNLRNARHSPPPPPPPSPLPSPACSQIALYSTPQPAEPAGKKAKIIGQCA